MQSNPHRRLIEPSCLIAKLCEDDKVKTACSEALTFVDSSTLGSSCHCYCLRPMMAVDDEGRGKGVFVRFNMMVSVGRFSSVGIATCYRLNCPQIRTAPIQTGRGIDTDTYTVGTGLFQGIKW
jgi:hypothetical protein